MLIASALLVAAPVLAGREFEATIEIDGDLEITVGETTTLTATWSTNGKDVTRYEWSVNGEGQGEVTLEGASSGTSTFDFSSNTAGTFTITFTIWHHVQREKNGWVASAFVIVVVIQPQEVEYKYETAYAYGGEYANSFIDYGFSNWGWSNGQLSEGSYTFDLYAGAAQCDIDKGVLVGTVSISYSGGTLSWEVTVNYPYILMNEEGEVEVHVYVGTYMFPTLPNGKSTVAPGMYGNTGSSGSVSGLSGDIYVIVHAIVGIPK